MRLPLVVGPQCPSFETPDPDPAKRLSTTFIARLLIGIAADLKLEFLSFAAFAAASTIEANCVARGNFSAAPDFVLLPINSADLLRVKSRLVTDYSCQLNSIPEDVQRRNLLIKMSVKFGDREKAPASNLQVASIVESGSAPSISVA